MAYKSNGLNATAGEDFSTIPTQNPHETENGPGDSAKINNVMLDSGSNSFEGAPDFDKNHPNNAFARKKSVNVNICRSPPGTAPNALKLGDMPSISNRTPRIMGPGQEAGRIGG